MTAGLSFSGLLVVALIAVAAPIVAELIPTLLPRVRLPGVVLEIAAGVAIGPAGFGWVDVDPPIAVLAVVGLAFLLFLAGLEIEIATLRGNALRLPVWGFVITFAVGLVCGGVFYAVDWVRSPFFLAVALSATSLGLVVPVLRDAAQADRPLGHLVTAGASIADFGAVILLSLFFSESAGGTASRVITVGLFAAVIAVVALTLGRAGRSVRIDALLSRLQDTTAEIRVRIAVALLIGFVALAARVGLETILGAFVAGALLGAVDRPTMTDPRLRVKLEAVGYGLLIPVFFVVSGMRLDLAALTERIDAVVQVPAFLAALLLTRGLPALLYRRTLGAGWVTAALLQATSLPFLVTAATIGVSIGAISPRTSSALVAAGLLSVLLFPSIAIARMRRSTTTTTTPTTAPTTTPTTTTPRTTTTPTTAPRTTTAPTTTTVTTVTTTTAMAMAPTKLDPAGRDERDAARPHDDGPHGGR